MVEFGISHGSLASQPSGCVVVGVYAGRRLSPAAAVLDAASGHALARVLARGDLDGEAGDTLLLHDVPQLAAERVLLVALGPEDGFAERRYRAALKAAIHALRRSGAAQATLCLHEVPVRGRDTAWKVEQAVLAVMDGLYRFDRLKSAPPPAAGQALVKLAFHAAGAPTGDPAGQAETAAAIARGTAIGQGVVLAKDLGNLPGNVCTPSYLAQEAQALGQRHGLDVTILDRDGIEKLGMRGFLAVARGSGQPPRLIVMAHRGGAPGSPPVVLVGKGITFDAGGISLKPPLEMDEMKFDMCGAASVFGALHAAGLMQLPLNVVGIVPATENMPDGNAVKPGDVVTTMSGTTVEILDTDSEGRVVLGDALTYAEQLQPAAVIDIATLTSEVFSALGDVASGLFTADDALARELADAGDRAWDRAWRLPLWDEYHDVLESNFADVANVGMRGNCAATAACFLSRFARRYPWAHLDIAGTAALGGADKGATGRPVALLVHWLAARAAGVNAGR